MFTLENFTFAQMTQIGATLRKLGEGAGSMEEVANRIVRYLYEHLVIGATDQKACALVRLFKTHAFDQLDQSLREFAAGMLQEASAAPEMKCLTLLATAGDKPEWNSRTASEGHKAIPLPSERALQRAPMISQLLSQLGLSFSLLQKPDPVLMLEMEQSTFNVFHVPEAQGSPYVPAQKEFVIPYRIQSVLGFGGLLPSGDLFAVILFSKLHITRQTAELFKTLALSTKLALISFSGKKILA